MRKSKRPRKKKQSRKQGLFEAANAEFGRLARKAHAKAQAKNKKPTKKATKKATPTAMAHFDPTFKHKAHYIVSSRSKTGYKGVDRDTSRSCTPWRVKYKGSTIKRCAFLGEACQVYYNRVQKDGPSSSRARAQSDDAIDMIERLDKA